MFSIIAQCIVSYLDPNGFGHSVEVEAESLFEEGVLAIRAFRQHDFEPGLVSQLEVEIRSSVTHVVTPKRIQEWLEGGQVAEGSRDQGRAEGVTCGVKSKHSSAAPVQQVLDVP